MTLRLRVLKVAEQDLAEAADWYASQDKKLRLDFVAAVDVAISKISAKPEGYAKRLRDYRVVLVRRFPYVIYYRLVAGEIRIAAVLHQSRGIKARTRRLTAGRKD